MVWAGVRHQPWCLAGFAWERCRLAVVPAAVAVDAHPPGPPLPLTLTPRDRRWPLTAHPRDRRWPLTLTPRDRRWPLTLTPRDRRWPLTLTPRDGRLPLTLTPRGGRPGAAAKKRTRSAAVHRLLRGEEVGVRIRVAITPSSQYERTAGDCVRFPPPNPVSALQVCAGWPGREGDAGLHAIEPISRARTPHSLSNNSQWSFDPRHED